MKKHKQRGVEARTTPINNNTLRLSLGVEVCGILITIANVGFGVMVLIIGYTILHVGVLWEGVSINDLRY